METSPGLAASAAGEIGTSRVTSAAAPSVEGPVNQLDVSPSAKANSQKQQSPDKRGFVWDLAVREGFEPSIRFLVYTLSRRAPSTARTPHRISPEV